MMVLNHLEGPWTKAAAPLHERSQLRCSKNMITWVPPEHIPLGGDPRAHPEPSERIPSPLVWEHLCSVGYRCTAHQSEVHVIKACP